ncbi:helix-turn-helix domain-containing protein, partial [Candidatus Liberibacter solanacearum]
MIITPEIRQNWEEVGMRIRDIRKAKGKTLLWLEAKSKIDNGAISLYENGKSSISINYSLFLRNEFGASFDWIYDGEIVIKAHKPKSSRCSVLDPVAIGLRLKGLREQFRLNKQEFGKSIGVTCQTIGQFEKGKMSPRIVIARE